MTTFKRLKDTIVEAKIESTEGVDASPAGTDAIRCENFKLGYTANLIKTNEYSGALDNSQPIVGGMKVPFSFDVYLKGNAAPGTTAPEWGRLMKACGFSETLTSAALGAPTALTAGSATTATLPSLFSGADQAYRGMPLLITGDQTTQTFIRDFIASTKIASLTDTLVALTSSSLAQIPANALYLPGSTGIPSLTFYVYDDGLLYKMLGCRGSVKMGVEAGGALKASFNFMGMFGGESDSSNPTPTYDSVTKPIWKNTGGLAGGPAAFTIASVAAALKSFGLDVGNQIIIPDDPNGSEGYGPAQITMRDINGTMDPYQSLISTRDIMTDFRGNTPRCLHLRLGSTAGNRIGITIPNGLYTDANPADNSGLNTRAVKFDATGNDSAGAQICVY